MQIRPVDNIVLHKNSKAQPAFLAIKPKNFYRPKQIKKWVAYQCFTKYSPLKLDFGEYRIPVHNEGIAQKLRSEYTPSSFDELFNFAKKKGVFDYTLDSETGFIKTSQINRKENELMSDIIWTTDTCHNIPLIKHTDPESCTKVFNSLTDFYERNKIRRSIQR